MTSGRLWNCNGKTPPYKDCGVKLISERQTPEKRTSVGKVEIYEKGSWTKICDKQWTKADADVTCKDLGFSEAIQELSLTYDVKENPITQYKIYRCTGSEKYLIECQKTNETRSSCTHVAGVRCKDEGKRLCQVCHCSNSSVDCSAKELYHVPWSNSSFGPNMIRDLSFNEISKVKGNLFVFSRNLTNLTMEHNRIKELPLEFFQSVSLLEYINLAFNLIHEIKENQFKSLKKLSHMDLSNNKLENLPKSFMAPENRLKYLNLQKNLLKTIPSQSLRNLKNLETLDLSNNKLENLPKSFMAPENLLKYLDLQENLLKKIPSQSLKNLKNLETLDISEMPRQNIKNWKFLLKMEKLKELKTSVFSQCCFVKKERPDVNCTSPKDNFSDCEKMIKSEALRYVVWVVLLVIFGGNVVAFALRIVYKDKTFIQNVLILNLNLADILMGLYIAAIVSRDLLWRGNYYLHDQEWRSSITCKSFGIIALVSSEVGVLTLAIITYDRRAKLVFGWDYKPMKRGIVLLIVCLVWLVSVTFAVIPAVVKSYFYDEDKAEGFYGTNGLCLPLQLPGERDPAWEYCLVIFGIFNFLVACYMAWAYCTIFYASYVSARNSNNVQRMKDETNLAIRFIAIVFTDILCWFPIAILIFISLAAIVSDNENILYAWFSICVITVNSAINPVIYTITNTFFWPKFKGWFKKCKCCICSCCCCLNNEGGETEAEQTDAVVRCSIEVTGAREGENEALAPSEEHPLEVIVSQTTGTTVQPAHEMVVVAQVEPLPRAMRKNKGTTAQAHEMVVVAQIEPLPRAMRKNEEILEAEISSQPGETSGEFSEGKENKKQGEEGELQISEFKEPRKDIQSEMVIEKEQLQEEITLEITEIKGLRKEIESSKKPLTSEKDRPSLIARILQAESIIDSSVGSLKVESKERGKEKKKKGEQEGIEMSELKWSQKDVRSGKEKKKQGEEGGLQISEFKESRKDIQSEPLTSEKDRPSLIARILQAESTIDSPTGSLKVKSKGKEKKKQGEEGELQISEFKESRKDIQSGKEKTKQGKEEGLEISEFKESRKDVQSEREKEKEQRTDEKGLEMAGYKGSLKKFKSGKKPGKEKEPRMEEKGLEMAGYKGSPKKIKSGKKIDKEKDQEETIGLEFIEIKGLTKGIQSGKKRGKEKEQRVEAKGLEMTGFKGSPKKKKSGKKRHREKKEIGLEMTQLKCPPKDIQPGNPDDADETGV